MNSAVAFRQSPEVASASRWLATLSLFVASLLLTRQAQVPALEGLAAPWALLVTLLYLRRDRIDLGVLPMLVYALGSLLFSLLGGVEPANAIRFFVITITTILACSVRPVPMSAPFALAPVALQGIFIAAISVTLSLSQDSDMASALRGMALETNWGDIYTLDGFYFRVQVIGNALLPLLFMIGVWGWSRSLAYKLMTLVGIMGLLAAGNLTYLIVAVIAVVMRNWKRLGNSWGRFAPAVAVPVVAVLLWLALGEMFSQKFGSSSSSMGVRFDQIDAAYREVGDSPLKLLFGAGLGANFPDGMERNYSQFQYIELQALYLFFQLGIAGSAIYLITLIAGIRRAMNGEGQLMFWLYVAASLTNPYILDANQIFVTICLVWLFPRGQVAAR